MADTFATFIVTTADAPTFRAAAFGLGGSSMWICPLSASGLDPATRYISTGYGACPPAPFVAMGRIGLQIIPTEDV